MSSPGSGKTTTLSRTIEALGDELALAVMEADIDSDVDAATIAKLGAKTIQLHTGGMCHLDAGMCAQGLEGLAADDADLVFLENVGNLVCPAEFDTGACKKAASLSSPKETTSRSSTRSCSRWLTSSWSTRWTSRPTLTLTSTSAVPTLAMRNPNARASSHLRQDGRGMDAGEMVPVAPRPGECLEDRVAPHQQLESRRRV